MFILCIYMHFVYFTYPCHVFHVNMLPIHVLIYDLFIFPNLTHPCFYTLIIQNQTIYNTNFANFCQNHDNSDIVKLIIIAIFDIVDYNSFMLFVLFIILRSPCHIMSYNDKTCNLSTSSILIPHHFKLIKTSPRNLSRALLL